MIRLDHHDDWYLLPHRDHAELAGMFARHWKNDLFSPPAPFAHILDAVSRHDDSWSIPDASPSLSPEGHPNAFSRELVGTYDAFEDIDLEAYLKVRGEATEQAALRDPYAAILISMHTVNLLTEQADLEGLGVEERKLHAAFIEGQKARQSELRDSLTERGPDFAKHLEPEALQRGFEFLQACDSFSLLAGVDYPEPSSLRHSHPCRNGDAVVIAYEPLGSRRIRLDPYPLDEPEIHLTIPYRRVPKSCADSEEDFRRAFRQAEVIHQPITVTGDPS